MLLFLSGDLKRRHSWSSEVDYQPETEAVTISRGDPAVPLDDDGISYKVSYHVSSHNSPEIIRILQTQRKSIITKRSKLNNMKRIMACK
jgi:hypothetical protein